MNILKYIRSLVFIILAFLSSSAIAGTYTCSQFGKTFKTYVPSASSGRFTDIKSSCETLVNNHWNNFGMEGKYWGWGYYNACYINSPLNRTLRALELLKTSKNNRVNNYSILNQAYDISNKSIDRLQLRCAKNRYDGAEADYRQGWFGTGTVNLYQNIFKRSIVEIATIIVHEARHKEKPHNGARLCPRKGSCDTSYWYRGANAYELNYAWWYGLYSKNSTKFTRQKGLDFARKTQDRAFINRPGFHIHKKAW